MIYIISILYSVFLGSIFRNFLSPKFIDSPKGVSIQFLVLKEKTSLVLGISVLYLIDWISFLIVYQPPSRFSFEIQDFILTLFYIPTVTFLTFALILALDTTKEKYCLSLSLYYICSTVAELFWIIMTVQKMNSIGVNDAVTILFISVIYIIMKGLWGVFFFLRHKELTVLNPTFLTFSSCVFKPALIIFLYYASNFGKLIQHP